MKTSFRSGTGWIEAQAEAQRWIDGLNLHAVTGSVIDLSRSAETLPFRGPFRTMVCQAAKRLLQRRGAYVILPG
ncbi:MAG: hypothetical protein ABIR38_00515 [Chthoniobacterales bacterium]|nr:hypothetical protein [Verrucomicrobiota bacterium]